MKKIVVILAVALVGLTASAQETRKEQQGRRGNNPEAMVQMQTNAMAEKYGLSQDQMNAVAELNTRYAGKIPMAHFSGRRPDGQKGNRPEMKEGEGPQRPQRPSGENAGEGQMQRGSRPQGRMQPQTLSAEQQKQQKANLKAYNKELKKIMNKTQFKAYKNDLKEAEEQA